MTEGDEEVKIMRMRRRLFHVEEIRVGGIMAAKCKRNLYNRD
jgi:hypothetical protein